MSETFKFAVVGNPVQHSLSPLLFRTLFRSYRMDANYSAENVPEDAFLETLQLLRQGNWAGWSVTSPYKGLAFESVDECETHAANIRAVNCIKREGQRLLGFNTDGLGFRKALEYHGQGLRGARMLLLGAGGAARAAAFTAVEYGISRLIVANRTEEAAEDLVLALSKRAEWDMDVSSAPLHDELKYFMREVDVIVNATSVGMGMYGDPLPAACEWKPHQWAMDMVYRPLHTPFLRRAQKAQARTVDGLWMLTFQAMEQFRILLGPTVPDTLAPQLVDVLRKAL